MNHRVAVVTALVLVGCDNANAPPPVAAQPTASVVATTVPAAPSSASAAATPSSAPSAATSAPTVPTYPDGVTALALPGTTGPASGDLIGVDAARSKVWLPVGSAGSVYVFDVAANAFARVQGFKTAEQERNGQKRVVGPSAVAVGDRSAFVVNRASGEVCVVDTTSLELGTCLKLAAAPDAIAYVAKKKEVWVTTPDDHSITILDASNVSALKAKSVVRFDGEPECTAVDEAKGLFYTNLEDKDRTVAVDLSTHAIRTNVAAGCGTEGPRGIAVDSARGLVMVACTDGVRVLDAAHGLAPLTKADTGIGNDDIDYNPKTQDLTVASGKAARITRFHVGAKGELTVTASATTSAGARNAVTDPSGTAYVMDGKNGKLLIVHLQPSH